MAKVNYKFNSNSMMFEEIKPDYNWKNILLRLIIYFAIAYFIIGYILVLLKVFELIDFLTIAGIVGAGASVAGLLTFISNRINKNDIEKIGIEYFKEVVIASEKLKEKEKILFDREKQLSSKEIEIKELELKKTELEFIVRKASMTIFLKDQLQRRENRIVEVIEQNAELASNIQQRIEIVQQLKDLQEEIEKSENTKLVEEMISLVSVEKEKEDGSKKTSLLDLLLRALLR